MGYMDSLPRPVATYHTKPYDRISKHHNFSGQGKTVIVTGGAGGVGLHIVKAFAEAGVARVAIISRSADQQKEAKAELEAAYPKTEFLTFQASITNHEAVNKVMLDIGTADILVLNAAVAHRRAPITDLNVEEAKFMFDTNVIPTFSVTQAFLALPPPASGDRTVINVSAAAAQMISGFRGPYGASKAAAVQIMPSFASQFAEDEHTRLFSFHPGSFYTPGVAANMPANFPGVVWEDEGLPAWFAVWLAGRESGFLDGRYMWAHWDVDELIALKDKIAADPNFMTIGLIQ